MWPSSSKRMVWASGETSSDIQVPSSVLIWSLRSGFIGSVAFFSSFLAPSPDFGDSCRAAARGTNKIAAIAATHRLFHGETLRVIGGHLNSKLGRRKENGRPVRPRARECYSI